MYFVLGGGGKVGEACARALLRAGHEVVIIELLRERVDQLARLLNGRFLTVEGNCCDAGALRDAGIENADTFIALTGQDDSNLAACEVSKTLFGVPRVIARVNSPKNERIFGSLGIDCVSSTMVVSREVEKLALSSEQRMLLGLRHGEFVLSEVDIPNTAGFRAQGFRRIADIDMPASTIVVAVSHGEGFETVDSKTVVGGGDTVVLFTTVESEFEAREALLDI